MAQLIEQDLLKVIKADDKKAFDALMEQTQCGAIRLGRFPTLSLLYLYNARKILSSYEERFIKITNYEILGEPMEISYKFSAKAGKCLRLYLNEIVSPLEMLLILDKTKKLKKIFSFTSPSSSVKGRLKAIYFIKYSLGVKFENNSIILDKRPLNYSEKKKVATACLCLVLAIIVAIGVPITTVSILPANIDKYIDLSSNEEFVLKRDVVLPKNYSVKEVNCTIIGNGHKLIVKKGATMGVLKGKISDLIIESNGDAIFTSISQGATIENVTINVNADNNITDSAAFVALNNYGNIDGVSVNVSGKVNALADSSQESDEFVVGGIVLNNNFISYDPITQTNYCGFIQNCKVNYTQFSLVGEASANASFAGAVGNNGGVVQDCFISGEIVANTFDVAGVCYYNSGLLSAIVNEADISQSSADSGWNPIVSGIVTNNVNGVENCENKGNISALSNCQKTDTSPTVSAAGIAYINNGSIARCINSGAVSATGIGEAYIGGIAAHSYASISKCLSSGNITVNAQDIYVGGVLGCSEVAVDRLGYVHFGTVDNCISESKINVSAEDTAYVGGITGYIKELGFEQQKFDEDGNIVKYMLYFGGGVTESYFIGECVSQVANFGNIVGVCGANIYEVNSITSSNGDDYHNFEDNYYLDNAFKAFGATANDENILVAVEDKGATCAAIDAIKNLQAYKNILGALNK